MNARCSFKASTTANNIYDVSSSLQFAMGDLSSADVSHEDLQSPEEPRDALVVASPAWLAVSETQIPKSSSAAVEELRGGAGARQTPPIVDDDAPRPPKRRRAEDSENSCPRRKRRRNGVDSASDSATRLSGSLKIAADAAVLPYACGDSECWKLVQDEMMLGAASSAHSVRFATSNELLQHRKSRHGHAHEGERIFRCGLKGCDKGWKVCIVRSLAANSADDARAGRTSTASSTTCKCAHAS